jgi:hypothetical protein
LCGACDCSAPSCATWLWDNPEGDPGDPLNGPWEDRPEGLCLTGWLGSGMDAVETCFVALVDTQTCPTFQGDITDDWVECDCSCPEPV